MKNVESGKQGHVLDSSKERSERKGEGGEGIEEGDGKTVETSEVRVRRAK